jgi:hypothetical protein
MTRDQKQQYKKNHIDNKTLEFACKHGRLPSIPTIKKWSREADLKLSEMSKQAKKWSNQ